MNVGAKVLRSRLKQAAAAHLSQALGLPLEKALILAAQAQFAMALLKVKPNDIIKAAKAINNVKSELLKAGHNLKHDAKHLQAFIHQNFGPKLAFAGMPSGKHVHVDNVTHAKAQKGWHKADRASEKKQANGFKRENATSLKPKVQYGKVFSLERYGRKTNGLSGAKKEIYEWDHLHNDLEVYDSNRKHLGSMDPITGKMYKPAMPGRELSKD